MQGQGPAVHVVNANTKRETGKKAQQGNIAAAKVKTMPMDPPVHPTPKYFRNLNAAREAR